MRRPRSQRMPPGEAGIWHIVSRCVRRERLMEGRELDAPLPGSTAYRLSIIADKMEQLLS